MSRTTTLLLIAACALLTSSIARAKEPPPADRTYFVYVMGLGDDPLVADVDCLTFDATQACTLDDSTCLDWERSSGGLQTSKSSGFSLSATMDEDGLFIAFDGQGRVESHGRKSSISGAARASALNAQLNFAFAGRQTSPGQCRRRVEQIRDEAGSP